MILVNGYLPTISKFPNNEEMVKLANLSKKDGPCVVEWFFEDDSEFMLLNQIESCLSSVDKYVVDCVIPYFPYERMDRQETDNPFSLEAAVSMLPKGWKYYVMEPHSDVLEKTFKGQELSLEIFWFNQFKYLSAPYFDKKSNIFVLPDKGSVSRYLGNEEIKSNIISLLEEGVAILVGGKQRDFDTHSINDYVVNQQLILVDGDIQQQPWNKAKLWNQIKDSGVDFIVVDDVISYGNTFLKLADYLKNEFSGIETEFKLHVAHAETALFKGDVLDTYDSVFTTNSLLHIPDSRKYVYNYDVKRYYPQELNLKHGSNLNENY